MTRSSDDIQITPVRDAEIWTWRLWGLRDPRLDIIFTVLALSLLVLSRFALLASGPWEWDETLFARGVLHFDIRAHYPHPPGFPLWIALGKLVLPFVANSLRGLQLLSAAASCALLWPLASLGRKVAPPAVAAASALAVLFAPGVWMHAVRGFSSTPATFFALWAGALAVHGLAGRRATAFTVLVTCAFLIRPILLPPFAVLWLAGALTARPRRRLLPGIAISSAAVAGSVVGMVLAQGSWASFVAPFIIHGRTHARNLATNAASATDLGLVKGVGGAFFAVTLSVLILLGLAVWQRRTSFRTTTAWGLIFVVAIAQLILLQNRTYSRYAVPVQLASAPLIAGAAGLAAPSLAVATLVALGGTWAIFSYPVVAEQRDSLMPGWEALQFAARAAERHDLDLVVEPGLYPFLSYLRESDRARGKEWSFKVFLAPASADASEYPERDFLVVTDIPERHLPAPLGRRWVWDHASPELEHLSQQRFLHAEVLEGVPLLISGWSTPETTADGETFSWGEPHARLLVPPYPGNPEVSLDIQPAAGPAPVLMMANGKLVAALAGRLTRQPVAIPRSARRAGQPTRITFERAEGYSPGNGDLRQLSVRFLGVAVASARIGWRADVVDMARRQTSTVALLDAGPPVTSPVTSGGFHRTEVFADRLGAWTGPEAFLDLPIAANTVDLVLWAPRSTPSQLTIAINGTPVVSAIDLPRQPTKLRLIADPKGRDSTRLTFRSRLFCPALSGSSTDTRELGIVLAEAVASAGSRSPVARLVVTPLPNQARWQGEATAPGMYSPERFRDVIGAWIKPRVRLAAPLGPGVLTLSVWAARPTPCRFEILAGDRRLAGPTNLRNRPGTLEVVIPAGLNLETLELLSQPFVPKTQGRSDGRSLGVVLSSLEFRPTRP